MQENNPFSVAKKIFVKDKVAIQNPFFMNTILSFIPVSLLWSIEVNKYMFRVPTWALNDLISVGIKKRKVPPFRIPYIKKDSNKKSILQEKINNAFCANEIYTKQIIELIKKQGLKPESFFGLKKGE